MTMGNIRKWRIYWGNNMEKSWKIMENHGKTIENSEDI